MILVTMLTLFVPQLIKVAIDRGLAAGEMGALLNTAGLLLLVGILRAIVGYGQRYYGDWLTYRVAYDLRNDYYDGVQYLPFEFHNRTQTGDLMSRATSDISETERFIGMGLMDLTAAVLLLVGVSVAMLLENARLASLGLIPLPVLV
jgi:ATP-binding cassette subfamily B protein